MGLIIDTYNVLHCTHVLPSRHAMMGATDLCRLLDESSWRSSRIAVVCDGSPKPDETDYTGSVKLIHSGSGSDADSVIEKLIASDTAPRDLTVVSNDRRVQRAARRRRCRVMTAERFLRQLVSETSNRTASSSSDSDPPASKADTEYWLREFGFNSDGSDDGEQ